MEERKDRPGFMSYFKEWEVPLDLLDDTDFMEMYRAIFYLAKDGEETTEFSNKHVKAYYKLLRESIIKDKEKYADIVKQNSTKGKKSALKRQQMTEMINSGQPVSTAVNSSQPVSTAVNSSQPVSTAVNSSQPVSTNTNTNTNTNSNSNTNNNNNINYNTKNNNNINSNSNNNSNYNSNTNHRANHSINEKGEERYFDGDSLPF